jgi:hypothetical protein
MKTKMPYRLDLAGGWLDQPYVSKYAPGPVITLCIEPTHEFMVRGGIATSTRNHALKIWKDRIPKGDREVLAKCLFGYENLPGNPYFTGSQDAIGMVYPGLNKLNYAGRYWPETIEHHTGSDALDFMEQIIRLVPVGPRGPDFDVRKGENINGVDAQLLAYAANDLWISALNGFDAIGVGAAAEASFNAQISMFPSMATPAVWNVINTHKQNAYGWKVTGAGGGGYVLFIAKREIPGSIRIKVRRK